MILRCAPSALAATYDSSTTHSASVATPRLTPFLAFAKFVIEINALIVHQLTPLIEYLEFAEAVHEVEDLIDERLDHAAIVAHQRQS